MKKIGFVDLYLSEWHAIKYPSWIKEANENLGTDYEVAYAWAEQEVSPVDGRTTDEWCAEYGVTRCDTIEEVCEKSDVIIILAPSNPEVHLKYAQKVLPYGKRTYIDKTFAPDYETAKEIFKISEETGTPFFSTSALRYASELKDFTNATKFIALGGGYTFEEYVIHLLEMIVPLLKTPAKRVKVDCIGEIQRMCRVQTEDDDFGLLFSPQLPHSMCVEYQLNPNHFDYSVFHSATFPSLLTDVLQFFEDGKLPFDPAQTLEIARIRTALLEGEKHDGEWLEINY